MQIVAISLDLWRVENNSRDGNEPLRLNQRFHVKSNVQEIDQGTAKWRKLTVIVSHTLAASQPSSSSQENEPELSIEAQFKCEYRLDATTPYTDDQITAFSRLNGPYNTWSYWREFVQSTVGRMGLPPLTLSLLTLPLLLRFIKDHESQSAN